ncbi:TIGR02584 family CRISPR-associated protein [Lujinxingia vulgaris]|uniref:TIGR02584 family CRISPR-associated protein n=1 Tax=Lujinxingia vulgaris TaxID=2600176 RepID=A0A5C6X7T5_9DELT|nr:CRISPR-associated ring nuclease Csm6 [Lujinxingia vulgaris]TXD34085.1 TIGR02584 family CRISPR-associated protein [Lujinxingia vulgaris]
MSEETTPDVVNVFCVVGASPAVVTETIFALCVEHPDEDTSPVCVERLVIVTTAFGKARLESTLQTQLEQMAQDYPAAAERIPTSPAQYRIVVPQGSDEAPLEDVRNAMESAIMGDAIAREIDALTAEGEPRLIASLAGGRKTMGFYVGATMSLRARPGDRLTHVLVSDGAERCPEFFYPTPEPRELGEGRTFIADASAIRVELHELPFARLATVHKNAPSLSYQEMVRRAEEGVQGPKELKVDFEEGEITYGGQLLSVGGGVNHAMYMHLIWLHARGLTPISTEAWVDPRVVIHESTPYVLELQDIYGRIDGGDGEAFFLKNAKALTDLKTLDNSRGSVRTAVGGIRRRLRAQLSKRFSESDMEWLIPPSGKGRGYTLNIPAERIIIVGAEELADVS